MPSLSTRNGNFSYYYQADEYSQSVCRSVIRFSTIILAITCWSILVLAWWIIANYILLNNTDLYFKYSLDYIDRYIQQIPLLLLHFLMLIMVTSAIRPYTILHSIIYFHNKRLIINFIFLLLASSILLEIPYFALKEKHIQVPSSLHCDYFDCNFWTIQHIIHYYIYCAVLPLILFIIWAILECTVLSKFGPLSNGRKKGSEQLQMSLLKRDESDYTAHELSAFLNDELGDRVRTYSTTFSILFYLILLLYWFSIQTIASLKGSVYSDYFLMIYCSFLMVNVVFKVCHIHKSSFPIWTATNFQKVFSEFTWNEVLFIMTGKLWFDLCCTLSVCIETNIQTIGCN